jgi:hypothetical protein
MTKVTYQRGEEESIKSKIRKVCGVEGGMCRVIKLSKEENRERHRIRMKESMKKKAMKGREARRGARVGHGPEGGAWIYGLIGNGWKRIEKVVEDRRKQGKEKGGQGHQESNLDPLSGNGRAPTPPGGHHTNNLLYFGRR